MSERHGENVREAWPECLRAMPPAYLPPVCSLVLVSRGVRSGFIILWSGESQSVIWVVFLWQRVLLDSKYSVLMEQRQCVSCRLTATRTAQ